MSAIFPPGGLPPGDPVCNGYKPNNAVIGEDPLYVAPDCTTYLTDCQMNALTSEILAAVDTLGFGYDTARINNLGEALAAKFTALQTALDDKVAKSGDTMTGSLAVPCPPHDDTDAACKFYVDDVLTACCADTVNKIDVAITNFQTELDGKVSRAGDFMTGFLLLSGDPTLPGHAATKNYVDNRSGGVVVAPNPPNVLPGRLWFNSIDGRLFLLYDDGDSTQWVDLTGAADGGGGGTISGNFLPLTGGSLTGVLILSGSPTATSPANQAATKGYVDSQIALGGTFIDAPPDGEIYGRQMNGWVPITVITDGGTY